MMQPYVIIAVYSAVTVGLTSFLQNDVRLTYSGTIYNVRCQPMNTEKEVSSYINV